MPADPDTQPARQRRRRADADRSVARILDAALDALANDPEASMAGIARQAGVVRATIYVHFPTREALIAAVTDRAIADVSAVIDAARPQDGDPAEALRRVVRAAWRELARFHALVVVNAQLPPAELHARHEPVLAVLQPLIERGQHDGTFRADVPPAWHLTMVLALIHAAGTSPLAGHLATEQVESALLETVLGAIAR